MIQHNRIRRKSLLAVKKNPIVSNFIYYWLVDSYKVISKKSYSKYFKYILRSIKDWGINNDWVKYINKTEQHQRWKSHSGCDFFSKMQYPYLSLHFNKKQQLNALKQHYDWVFLNFNEDSYYNEINLFSYSFIDNDNQSFLVEISCDFKSPFEYEGEISFFMKVNGEIQYTLTFLSIIENGISSLFIGGLQAGKPTVTDLEGLKHLTKIMYGLRPKQLILHSLSIFASYMNIHQIIAISNENHIFSKKQRRWSKKKLKTSLNSFWEEFDVHKNDSGNYMFAPLSSNIDLEKIVSKKRSQYRKRQVILTELTQQIENNISKIIKS
jgi:uncharacterized protein